jgi:hypothetical protein
MANLGTGISSDGGALTECALTETGRVTAHQPASTAGEDPGPSPQGSLILLAQTGGMRD